MSEVHKGWLEKRSLQLVPPNFGVEDFASVKHVGKLARYLITNLSPQEAEAKQVLTWLWGHWTIENHLHRTRDVQNARGALRIRRYQAARVLAGLSSAIIGLLTRRGSAPSNMWLSCFVLS